MLFKNKKFKKNFSFYSKTSLIIISFIIIGNAIAWFFGITNVISNILVAPDLKLVAGESIVRIAQSGTNLGISGDKFTVNGQPTFLLGVSLFDALGKIQDSDLDYLAANNYNLIRIWLYWRDKNIAYDSNGYLLPNKKNQLVDLVQRAGARGIVVDVTALFLYEGYSYPSFGTDVEKMKHAVGSVAKALNGYDNVLIDVMNEHNHKGNVNQSHQVIANLISEVKNEDPDRIVTVSSTGKHIINSSGSLETTNINQELSAGIDVMAPHFYRSSDWYSQTDDRVIKLKNYLRSQRQNIPIYLQEENYYPQNGTLNQMVEAATLAKQAGAAAWVFHQTAGFDLSNDTFKNNLLDLTNSDDSTNGQDVLMAIRAAISSGGRSCTPGDNCTTSENCPGAYNSSCVCIDITGDNCPASAEERSNPLVVDTTNPRWLRYKNGDPFFMCGAGDPEDFLYRGDRRSDGTRNGDQMSLVNRMKSSGANGIYMQIIRSNGGDGDSTHNPFIDSVPSNGLDNDILDQWDSWFTEMDDAGIVVYLFFYDDHARIWGSKGSGFQDADRQFVTDIVNRFEHHDNIIWVVAEEYEEKWTPEEVSEFAAVIRSADDNNHPIAVHKHHGLDFSDLANDPNIDQFSIQYNKDTPTEIHTGIVQAWQRAGGKYNLALTESYKYGTGAEARRKNWAAAMGGAYVMMWGWGTNYADIINGVSKSDVPQDTEMKDCGRMKDFFLLTDFTKMAPHDELKAADTDYVLADEGESYIAYSINAKKLGLKNMGAGTYNFLWFDTVNGKKVNQNNVTVTAGNNLWPVPNGIGEEAAVWITKVGGGGEGTGAPQEEVMKIASNAKNPAVAVDSSGNLHFAYDCHNILTSKGPAAGNVCYRKVYNSKGGILMTDEVDLLDAPLSGLTGDPRIGIDGNGNVHIIAGSTYVVIMPTGNIVKRDFIDIDNPRLAVSKKSSESYLLYREVYKKDRGGGIFLKKLSFNGGVISEDWQQTVNPRCSKPQMPGNVIIDETDTVFVTWRQFGDQDPICPGRNVQFAQYDRNTRSFVNQIEIFGSTSDFTDMFYDDQEKKFHFIATNPYGQGLTYRTMDKNRVLSQKFKLYMPPNQVVFEAAERFGEGNTIGPYLSMDNTGKLYMSFTGAGDQIKPETIDRAKKEAYWEGYKRTRDYPSFVPSRSQLLAARDFWLADSPGKTEADYIAMLKDNATGCWKNDSVTEPKGCEYWIAYYTILDENNLNGGNYNNEPSLTRFTPDRTKESDQGTAGSNPLSGPAWNTGVFFAYEDDFENPLFNVYLHAAGGALIGMPVLKADFNCDAKIDLQDFGILLSHWDKSGDYLKHYSHPKCGGSEKNLNLDDVVPVSISARDFGPLLSCWTVPTSIYADACFTEDTAIAN